MKNILAEQTLAALINAPAQVAEKSAKRIETADFENWQHQRIFDALLHCALADHQEPGSVIIQINAYLLDQGHYADQDTGLRKTVEDLVGIIGHPEQLPGFISELIEYRFRRTVAEFAESITDHADTSPLADVDAALRGIGELRRLRARIDNTTQQLSVVREEGESA